MKRQNVGCATRCFAGAVGCSLKTWYALNVKKMKNENGIISKDSTAEGNGKSRRMLINFKNSGEEMNRKERKALRQVLEHLYDDFKEGECLKEDGDLDENHIYNSLLLLKRFLHKRPKKWWMVINANGKGSIEPRHFSARDSFIADFDTEADAEEHAIWADGQWPDLAPHRVVRVTVTL